MGSDPDFVLYTDGGSDGGKRAAGACIVEDVKTQSRLCFGVFLGAATNNEAEIFAALLGFSAIHFLDAKKRGEAVVRWVADSEYLLKGATGYIRNWQRNGWKTADKKPVKNQGLWQTYLTLSSGLKIVPEHVRGHTGHVENEACDEAVQWVKAEAEEIFIRSNCLQAEISTTLGRNSWTVVDARKEMELLRSDMPHEEHQLFLVEILQNAHENGSSLANGSAAVRIDPLRAVFQALEQALKAAEKAASDNDEAAEIAKSIQEIIGRKRNRVS